MQLPVKWLRADPRQGRRRPKGVWRRGRVVRHLLGRLTHATKLVNLSVFHLTSCCYGGFDASGRSICAIHLRDPAFAEPDVRPSPLSYTFAGAVSGTGSAALGRTRQGNPGAVVGAGRKSNGVAVFLGKTTPKRFSEVSAQVAGDGAPLRVVELCGEACVPWFLQGGILCPIHC